MNARKVERLMCEHRIVGVTLRRRCGLTRRAKKAVFAADLIRRDFIAPWLGMRLVGDMTELVTAEGKVYLDEAAVGPLDDQESVDEVEFVLEVVERSWSGASHWSPFQAVARILLMRCVRRLRHCLGRGRAGPGWWWGVRRWCRAGRGWSRCRLWPSGTSPPSGGRRRVPPATAQRPRRHTRRDGRHGPGRPGRRRLAREPRVRRRRRLQHQPRPALPGLSGTPRPGLAGRPAVDPGPGLPRRSRHSASIWIRWKSSRIRCANAICSSLGGSPSPFVRSATVAAPLPGVGSPCRLP
ncbi:hypothetical protein H1V43_35495 [Streptomyces sp. PSKA54]|uniref:Transposase n=1 Tax=Streptomyces himalayensis subsp. aureolus TaxID=2758039 RepID=A0A7W2HJV4_9ACTN|nr:hypothetical protein [Streptomyces himalayensis subsp. aureolus]